MATTVTTSNPNGLGYQTGSFSLPTGPNISAAFSNRLFDSNAKYYRKAITSQVTTACTMSRWLEEFGGVDYDCHKNYSILEYNGGNKRQITVKTNVTIAANPTTTAITLSNSDHYVSGAYVLPQVGDILVLPPNGVFATITAVTHSAANTTTVTVVQLGASTIDLVAGQKVLVAAGKELADCATPTGQFRVPDLPIEQDYTQKRYAAKGVLCGADLEACQYFKIPFLDANGKEIPNTSPWYTIAETKMYNDLEYTKYIVRLRQMIDTIKARGIKLTPADPLAYSLVDFQVLKQSLRGAGIMTSEYAIFAGIREFSRLKTFLLSQGVAQLNYAERPLNDCSWLNMDYCGFNFEGMSFHIYEDCSFGNGMELGAAGYVFPDSSIWVPLDERPIDYKYSLGTANRNGDMRNKKFATVYFQSVQGRKYDLVVDSNGILGPRNGLATGDTKQEWTVQTEFTFEVYGADSYVYTGL